jgi:hypothetical protein
MRAFPLSVAGRSGDSNPRPRREALRATFLERRKARCPHEGGDTGRRTHGPLPPRFTPFWSAATKQPPVQPPAEASGTRFLADVSAQGKGSSRIGTDRSISDRRLGGLPPPGAERLRAVRFGCRNTPRATQWRALLSQPRCGIERRPRWLTLGSSSIRTRPRTTSKGMEQGGSSRRALRSPSWCSWPCLRSGRIDRRPISIARAGWIVEAATAVKSSGAYDSGAARTPLIVAQETGVAQTSLNPPPICGFVAIVVIALRPAGSAPLVDSEIHDGTTGRVGAITLIGLTLHLRGTPHSVSNLAA